MTNVRQQLANACSTSRSQPLGEETGAATGETNATEAAVSRRSCDVTSAPKVGAHGRVDGGDSTIERQSRHERASTNWRGAVPRGAGSFQFSPAAGKAPANRKPYFCKLVWTRFALGNPIESDCVALLLCQPKRGAEAVRRLEREDARLQIVGQLHLEPGDGIDNP